MAEELTPPEDGFTGNVHEDGRIELLMWAGGKCVNSFYVSDENISKLAAALLQSAHQSAQIRVPELFQIGHTATECEPFRRPELTIHLRATPTAIDHVGGYGRFIAGFVGV